MFPFIFAFILAIAIPFLPSSLYKALHLPSLMSNFLSASYAPERSLVSSSARSLLLQNGYSRDSSESGGSPQYLVFTSPSYSDHEVDSDVLAYMSFTEKLELTYPQTSIWLVICAPLLYKLVEAMVLMTLSFLFASTILSRRSLSTFIERSCTAGFICRYYTPKAALSSFLPDVLLCVHKYWMDNSVTSDQAPTTPANTSQHVLLEVLANSILSTATISEGLDLVATKDANLSENSSSVALITPPRYRETSASLEPALIPLGHPAHPLSTGEQGTQVKPILLPTSEPRMNVASHPLGSTTELSPHEQSSSVLGTPVGQYLLRSTISSFITTRAKNHNNGVSTSSSNSVTHEVPASLNHNSAPSFVTISLQDMYRANKPDPTSIPHSAPPGDGRENKAPDVISGSSLDHGSITNVNSSPSIPEPDESQAEGLRPSSSERSHNGRRRYKSDGIQVRSASCHLGDPAAPPDPATVNGTCVFWKNTVRNDKKGGGTAPEERALAPGFPSGSPSLKPTSRSMPGQAVAAGSADAVLAGMVLTPEGEILVPASQRADGSMRKEIKVRPSHVLREPLAEKYRPPPARARTLTWDPSLRELLASPLSSPSACNSSLPFTPKSVHQRFSGRQSNSPASLTNNWRRFSPTLTFVETQLAKGNDPCTAPPPPVEKLPAPDFSTPSQTMAIVSSRAFEKQSSLDQLGNQILSRSSELDCEKVSMPAPDDRAEQTESNKPVRAAAQVANSAASPASPNAEKENRVPLRDITASLVLSDVVDRLNPPSMPNVLVSTTARTFSLQVAKVIQRELELPSRTPVMEPRETPHPSPHRKRKPSGEPHTPYIAKSATFSPSESPTSVSHRRPRSRRSTPHLGKSASGKRQVKAQTPEGSAKRRRMRTTSARGMENIALAVTAAATAIDRNGQIVLPAGTGWKGRSLNSLIPSQLPVAQRQRQPSLTSDAAT